MLEVKILKISIKLNHETVLNDNEIPFIIDEKYAIDIDTYKDLEEARKVMM